MLNRLLITIIIISLIGGGIWGYLYFKKVNAPISPIIKAVPKNAAIIFETKNFQALVSKLNNNNTIWKELLQANSISKLNEDILLLNSLFKGDTTASRYINNSPVLASAHMSGVSSYNFLFLVNLPNTVSEDYIDAFINKSSREKLNFIKRTYEGAVITSTKLKGDKEITYSLYKGVFISSFSPLLVEESIRQLNSPASLLDDSSFKRIASTTGTKVDGNILVNYKYFPSLLYLHLQQEIKKDTDLLPTFAGWTALDLRIKKSSLMLNGFTLAADTKGAYLNIFLKQEPQEIELTSVIPLNVAHLTYYGVSNFRSFYRDYKSYLENNNKLFSYNTQLTELNEKHQINCEELLLNIIGNEFCSIITEPVDTVLGNYTYGIFKLSDPSVADSLYKSLSPKDSLASEPPSKKVNVKKGRNKREERKPQLNYEIYKNIEIRPFIAPELFMVSLGRSFKRLNAKSYSIIEGYIVFANSSMALKSYINYYSAGKTLATDINYKSFSDNLSDKVNLYIYNNIARSACLLQRVFKEEEKEDLKRHDELIKKFEGFGVQFNSDKDIFYNNVFIRHNPVYKKENIADIEVELEAPLASGPFAVTNHLTGEKELFIQDNNFNIYLINENGKILWQLKLKEKIESEVYQVDSKRNGKLQILFNTKSAIHLIDRTGKYVENYPVKLKAPATNSIAVFDYDNNRDYRVLINCQDKKLYNYSIEGSIVKGWEYPETKDAVYIPVKHTVIDQKDHLIIVDNSGNVYSFDRKGKARFIMKEMLSLSQRNEFYIFKSKDFNSSGLISTDSTGSVIKLFFNKKKESISLSEFSTDHYFLYEDVTGDKIPEYIIADVGSLSVFKQDESLLFKYDLNSEVINKPFILKGNKTIIGLSFDEGIDLLDSQGNLIKHFSFNSENRYNLIYTNDNFRLITGGTDNKLYLSSIDLE